MPDQHTFVLSTEDENDLNIIVLTEGINMDDFLLNPIMCLNHKSDIVLGRWANPRKDIRGTGRVLLAEPEFDEENECAKEWKRKVDKGFVKGVSVMLDFSYNDFTLEHPDHPGKMVLVKSKLREASIAPIPANSRALKLTLTDASGKQLNAATVLQLSKEISQNKNPMNKLLIAICASLKLDAASTEDQVIAAVQTRLNDLQELETLRKEKSDWQTEKSTMQLSKATDLIDGAITAKKITPDLKDTYMSLAKGDYEGTKKILDAIPSRVSLSVVADQNAGLENKGADETANWKWDDFHRKSPNKLQLMKTDDPERYKRLFNERYGK